MCNFDCRKRSLYKMFITPLCSFNSFLSFNLGWAQTPRFLQFFIQFLTNFGIKSPSLVMIICLVTFQSLQPVSTFTRLPTNIWNQLLNLPPMTKLTPMTKAIKLIPFITNILGSWYLLLGSVASHQNCRRDYSKYNDTGCRLFKSRCLRHNLTLLNTHKFTVSYW